MTSSSIPAAIGENGSRGSEPAVASAPPGELPRTRIEPSRRSVSSTLRELWQYRQLVYFLCWRDVKARYKQTVLGVAWAILQPVCTMIVFSIFFGRLAKIPSNGVPYPIFAFAALVPWHFFANGLSQGSASLVIGSNLVTKVYFPRLAMPLAGVLSGIVDFALAFLVLVAMMLYYGIAPSAPGLAVPLFLVLALVTSLGSALWLSALYVKYRDIRHVIPFLVQLWLFSTPVGYPSSLLPEPWRTVYGLNPMATVVEGFRWALAGTAAPPAAMIPVSCLSALALLVSGGLYFRRTEKTFADVV